jgi:hypothetical protein
VTGEVKPFKQLADYLSSRGVFVFRYEQRQTSGLEGGDTNLAYAAIQADLRAAIDKAVLESGVEAENVHIISHNSGFDLAASVLGEYNVKSLTALSPQAGRVDSVLANRVERHYDKCLNQKQIGSFIGKEIRDKADSIYKGLITGGNILPYEGLPMAGQYPGYWREKLEVSAGKIEAVNEWDGDVLIIHGTSDDFVRTESITRLKERIQLGEGQLDVKAVEGLNNILTISPSNQMDQVVLEEIAMFILGPSSVREVIAKDLLDTGNGLEYRGNGFLTMSIADISGRILATSNSPTIEKPSVNGFYILIIETSSGIMTYKFVN